APTDLANLAGIMAPLTINSTGPSVVVNISDVSNPTSTASTLSASSLTSSAFGTGGSISYNGLTLLNINLGSGGTKGNSFAINVAAGQNLPATTNISGGSAGKDSLTAAWGKDFNGNLNLLRFATSAASIGNNFNGVLNDV